MSAGIDSKAYGYNRPSIDPELMIRLRNGNIAETRGGKVAA